MAKNNTIVELAKKLNFADSKIPIFKQNIGMPFTKYGEKDDYGDYLMMLYNKSSKHAAIINGKLIYIFANGLICEDETNASAASFLDNANEDETWNELIKNCILDIENFGGFALQCLPKLGGNGFNYYKVSFKKLRTNKDNSKFFFKENWKDHNETAKEFEPFNRTAKEPTIFYFKEYRCDLGIYPLPSWVAACNWIESDVEVSKATLTKAMTGFSASKMINFFTGEPAEDEKRAITNQVKNKFNGSEGETVLITFNTEKLQAPEVLDLGSSDLTKEDFTRIDELITSNIFAAHSVTHPLLFGIQQAGKLGNASELKTAFDIFKNTYANAKQRQIEQVVNYFAQVNGVIAKFKIKDIEPVGIDIDAATMLQVAPKEWITDKLGIDAKYFEVNQSQGAKQVINALNSLSPLVANKVLESMGEDEIRSLVNLSPKSSTLDANGMPIVAPVGANSTNDVLTNLTGRQRQNIMAIVRQFGQGKLTKQQAAIMLKSGFGFTDDDVNAYLGIDEDPLTKDAKFSSDENEAEFELMFNDISENSNDFTIIKSTPLHLFKDESSEMQFAFAAANSLNESEQTILNYIKENPTATNEMVANMLGLSVDVVDSVINKFIAEKIIEKDIAGTIKVIVKTPKVEVPQILIRYSYEKRSDAVGRSILPTTRPFCKKLVGMSEQGKVWSRQNIMALSQRLGYDVFKRVGGFWNNNGNIEFHCRHEWVAHAVTKK